MTAIVPIDVIEEEKEGATGDERAVAMEEGAAAQSTSPSTSESTPDSRPTSPAAPPSWRSRSNLRTSIAVRSASYYGVVHEHLTRYDVPARGGVWRVQLDSSRSHVLLWVDSPLSTVDHETLLPQHGGVNLYTYPKILSSAAPHGRAPPSPESVRVLDEILIWLGINTDALLAHDDVGACAIHALLP